MLDLTPTHLDRRSRRLDELWQRAGLLLSGAAVATALFSGNRHAHCVGEVSYFAGRGIIDTLL
jgi:hypothetical protein